VFFDGWSGDGEGGKAVRSTFLGVKTARVTNLKGRAIRLTDHAWKVE